MALADATWSQSAKSALLLVRFEITSRPILRGPHTIDNIRLCGLLFQQFCRIEISIDEFNGRVLLDDMLSFLFAPNKSRYIPVRMGLGDGKETVTSNVAGCPCSNSPLELTSCTLDLNSHEDLLQSHS